MKNMQKYDFLIVGAGLFGAVFAYEAMKRNKSVLMIEKNDHIAGNCYTEEKLGIQIHKHGAHIFHTDKKWVWDYYNQFGEFHHFINQPLANVDGVIYNLPFNMNMFSKLFGVVTPEEAEQRIMEDKKPYLKITPSNLEEQALKSVGVTIYEKFVKGYTEKQWGISCRELPAETIKRLPIRLTYDNNYFFDRYQGIAKYGYTHNIQNMLQGVYIELNTVYSKNMDKYAKHIIYTGMIDEYFNYEFGELDYRSLEFVEMIYNKENHQGNAVVNYPTLSIPYTRSIEHKHFYKKETDKTIVSYEFSKKFERGMTPYYPIGNKENLDKYKKYETLSNGLKNISFCGRLGQYKYFDMDDTIEEALKLSKKLL